MGCSRRGRASSPFVTAGPSRSRGATPAAPPVSCLKERRRASRDPAPSSPPTRPSPPTRSTRTSPKAASASAWLRSSATSKALFVTIQILHTSCSGRKKEVDVGFGMHCLCVHLFVQEAECVVLKSGDGLFSGAYLELWYFGARNVFNCLGSFGHSAFAGREPTHARTHAPPPYADGFHGRGRKAGERKLAWLLSEHQEVSTMVARAFKGKGTYK